MQISERLNLVADFVPACQTAADIGTDHGYIPIELIKRKTVQYAYAMDIVLGITYDLFSEDKDNGKKVVKEGTNV